MSSLPSPPPQGSQLVMPSLPSAAPPDPAIAAPMGADPFAPAPELVAAAPPPPTRPQFGAPPVPPSRQQASLLTESDVADVAPAAAPRKVRKGFVPTLPARLVAFLALPVMFGLSLLFAVQSLRAETTTEAEELAGGPVAAGALVASIVVFCGLFWWMIAAAVNARRISQLSVSPWTPVIVLLGGPAVSLVGGIINENYANNSGTEMAAFLGEALVWVGIGLLTLGHLVLLASYRSTAERLGGPRTPWSVLIWLPIFSALIQATLTFIVYPKLESDRVIVFIWLLSLALTAVLSVAYVLSMWRAMASFEAAVRRDRSLEKADLLPTHFVYGRL